MRLCSTCKVSIESKKRNNKTVVINEPLGQTHSLAYHVEFAWIFVFQDFEKFGWTDGRTTCAKTMITTSNDCGSAEWIKNRISRQIYIMEFWTQFNFKFWEKFNFWSAILKKTFCVQEVQNVNKWVFMQNPSRVLDITRFKPVKLGIAGFNTY